MRAIFLDDIPYTFQVDFAIQGSFEDFGFTEEAFPALLQQFMDTVSFLGFDANSRPIILDIDLRYDLLQY